MIRLFLRSVLVTTDHDLTILVSVPVSGSILLNLDPFLAGIVMGYMNYL